MLFRISLCLSKQITVSVLRASIINMWCNADIPLSLSKAAVFLIISTESVSIKYLWTRNTVGKSDALYKLQTISQSVGLSLSPLAKLGTSEPNTLAALRNRANHKERQRRLELS